MKVEVTALDCCIALTEAQWNKLRKMEDAHFEKTEKYVFFPSTWKFPQCENVIKWEWNGHFGRNIFFTASDGAEKYALAFLKKLLGR